MQIRTPNTDAARRFLREVLGWQPAGENLFRPVSRLAPMVELAEGEPGEPGFFCIHFEIEDVDQVLPRTSWLELTERGRENRPTGRDLLNIRWPGWKLYAALFSAREPY